MDFKGKSAKALEELRAAKAAELQKIFTDNTAEGSDTPSLTGEQLNDVKTRHAELTEIGAARTAALENEKIQAELKAFMAEPVRPNFGGSPAGTPAAAVAAKSLGLGFVESKQYKEWLVNKPSESQAWDSNYSLKTLLTTSTGWPPQAVRSPLVVPYATQPPQVTDLIPTIQTTQNAFVYMEETTFTNAAVEVAEGAAKPEATLALTQKTSPVRKIAVWIPVTDEQLEDVTGMQDYIESRLAFMVRQRLDRQILTGTGVAPNLLGILATVGIQTQAKSTDPTPDAIYKAMTKVEVIGQAVPSAVVMHPNDWAEIRLLRTTDGIYIWGNPSEPGPESIFGLPVVKSVGLTEGTGLVGDFNNYSLLVERKAMTIKIGYNADDFVKNQRSIVAEIRVAFVVTRPAAFCSVTGI